MVLSARRDILKKGGGCIHPVDRTGVTVKINVYGRKYSIDIYLISKFSIINDIVDTEVMKSHLNPLQGIMNALSRHSL